MLCIDEKTGMQALSRSRDLVVARPGRAGRFEFEYKRNGTRCLFACFNVAMLLRIRRSSARTGSSQAVGL